MRVWTWRRSLSTSTPGPTSFAQRRKWLDGTASWTSSSTVRASCPRQPAGPHRGSPTQAISQRRSRPTSSTSGGDRRVLPPAPQESGRAHREHLLHHVIPVSYTHLRAHETDSYLVC